MDIAGGKLPSGWIFTPGWCVLPGLRKAGETSAEHSIDVGTVSEVVSTGWMRNRAIRGARFLFFFVKGA